MSRRAVERLAPALLALTAGYAALAIGRAELGPDGEPSSVLPVDTHSYFVPNLTYLWESIRQGAGFFWNPYQSCGQPVFGVSTTGLLYPPNWLFAWLDPDVALLAGMVFHLCLGGVGAFLLARRFVAPVAALCGALVFQLGELADELHYTFDRPVFYMNG